MREKIYTKNLTIRFDEETYKILTKLSFKKNTTKSLIIRNLVHELDNKESKNEVET